LQEGSDFERIGSPVDKGENVNTILVGYDETEASERALDRAIELAKAFGSRVLVTSVAPILEGAGRSTGPLDPTDMPEKHAAELERAEAKAKAAGLSTETVLAVGHPGEAIVQVAREKGADLIVVGTRELGFMQRMLGQSVSEAVAHHARCDVMIVH
jgi:nucleotide-binding universal stress UspA family protein